MTKLSAAQAAFLSREEAHRKKIAAGRWLLFFFVIGLWELAADRGWINGFIFSSPGRCVKLFLAMTKDGELLRHIGVTIAETLLSFFLVTVISLAAALGLWKSKLAAEILEPYLVALNSLPKSALAPVLIVWLGNQMRTIIVAAVSIALFGSILTLLSGFRQTDPDKIRLIRSLGGNDRDVMLKVVLPSAFPLMLSNMKVNIGLCLVGVIIGEFLAAREGLGYLIIYGSQVFKMDMVIMSILILCLMSAAGYRILTKLEKKMTKYK